MSIFVQTSVLGLLQLLQRTGHPTSTLDYHYSVCGGFMHRELKQECPEEIRTMEFEVARCMMKVGWNGLHSRIPARRAKALQRLLDSSGRTRCTHAAGCAQAVLHKCLHRRQSTHR